MDCMVQVARAGETDAHLVTAALLERLFLSRGTAAGGLRPVPPVPSLRTAGARPNRLGWCSVFCAAHHWTLQRAGFTSGSRTDRPVSTPKIFLEGGQMYICDATNNKYLTTNTYNLHVTNVHYSL